MRVEIVLWSWKEVIKLWGYLDMMKFFILYWGRGFCRYEGINLYCVEFLLVVLVVVLVIDIFVWFEYMVWIWVDDGIIGGVEVK